MGIGRLRARVAACDVGWFWYLTFLCAAFSGQLALVHLLCHFFVWCRGMVVGCVRASCLRGQLIGSFHLLH